MEQTVLGVIISNRDFFPDHLVSEARRELLAVLRTAGVTPVILDEGATPLGAVETWDDAQRCAALFRAHRGEIDGILVALPNFGDERGVAEAIRLAELNVPILVQAHPDDLDRLGVEDRRDAFCGKVSVCNNLRQYRLPFSLTAGHTVRPDSPAFRADLDQFLAVCRVVRGLRGARLGAVGARPAAFNTVRYSEKLLQASGISVVTMDLSELLAEANALADDDAAVRERLDGIHAYVSTGDAPAPALVRMARVGVALDRWMAANGIVATALQCWNSLQRNIGINVCTLMSMMSERLMPSACEVDVAGAVSMYALQLASGRPSALVDWNNNYADDPDKCVLFHCGNWARSFYGPTPSVSGLGDDSADTPAGDAAPVWMAYAEILGTTLGNDNTWGTLAGRVPAGPLSYARVTTDDLTGRIRAYVGDGAFTDDPLPTFGSRAVVQVPNLQGLMRHICKEGFEHHVAMSPSHVAGVLAEALDTYLGWEVYRHS